MRVHETLPTREDDMSKMKAQTATERLAKVPDELKKIAGLAMREGDRDLAFKVLAFADDIAGDSGKPGHGTRTSTRANA